METLQLIAIFLVSTLFSLYIGAVLIRFLLAWSRADFYNPLSQFLVRITNPVLVPLRRVIPAAGKLDTASLVLAVGLQFIGSLLLDLLGRGNYGLPTLLLASAADVLRTIIWIYIFALIIQAVLSWVGNSYDNPVASLLNSLTRPLLQPLRRFVPTIGMVDLSPLVAILLLQIVLIILRGLPGIF